MAGYDEDLVIRRRRGERVHVYGGRCRWTPNLRIPRSSRGFQNTIWPLAKHWHGIGRCSPGYHGNSGWISCGRCPNETGKAREGWDRQCGRQHRASCREAHRWLCDEGRLASRSKGTARQDPEVTVSRRPDGRIRGISRKQSSACPVGVCRVVVGAVTGGEAPRTGKQIQSTAIGEYLSGTIAGIRLQPVLCQTASR